MKDNFSKCLAYVLASEGGYVNNPRDPGGATNRGITQAVYNAYRAKKGSQALPVKMINPQEVAEIYRAQYWDTCKCEELPPGVDYCTFDGAVNSGNVTSAKWLQRVLGVVVDGHIGLATVAASLKVNDRHSTINSMCDMRLTFLHRLKQWLYFGKGWSNRMADVRKRALAM